MSDHDVHAQIKTYKKVFWALAVLTVVTVLVSYAPFGVAMAVIVGLAIATVKGGLVASFFMHLSSEKKWVYGVLILTAIFFVFLFVLPIATSNDTYGTPVHHDLGHGDDGHHGEGH